jgi:hypothetical protein
MLGGSLQGGGFSWNYVGRWAIGGRVAFGSWDRSEGLSKRFCGNRSRMFYEV